MRQNSGTLVRTAVACGAYCLGRSGLGQDGTKTPLKREAFVRLAETRRGTECADCGGEPGALIHCSLLA